MANGKVNMALVKAVLRHKDMKTTLGVYARAAKQAELEAKQIGHAAWFKAAEQAPGVDNVKPITQKRS